MKTCLFPLVLLLGWAGCSEKAELPETDPGVRISGRIVRTGESTRTSFAGSTASFITGDKIGVSDSLMPRRNVLFTNGASGWTTTTPMYWYNATSTDAFYAYYPYNASNQGYVVTMPLLSAQTFGTTPDPASDMLVAVKRQARTAGTSVGLTFTHAFALLQFDISAPLISTYTLQKITIRGGNAAGGASTAPYGIVNQVNAVGTVGYNVQTRSLSVTAANNNATNFLQSVSGTLTSGVINLTAQTFYALVLPGTYTGTVPQVMFTVTKLLTGPKDSNYVDLNNTTFVPGIKYVYKVVMGGLIGVRSPAAEQPSVSIELLRTESAAAYISNL